MKGIPDIIGIIGKTGRLLAIEVKKPGGRVSPEQTVFIADINARGGFAFVAYSVDDVIAKLAEAKRLTNDVPSV